MKSNLASHFQCPLLKKKLILSVLIITVLVFGLVLNYTIKTEENLGVKSNCLFCDIANGRQRPPELEFENDEYVIFKDKYPAATHHYLAVPKEHFASLKVLNKSHVGLGNTLNIYIVVMYVLNQIYLFVYILYQCIGNSVAHAGRNDQVSVI